jgi:hypothetical protein
MNRAVFVGIPVFVAFAVGCAHPQPVAPSSASTQLTAATTAAPTPVPAPQPAPVAVEEKPAEAAAPAPAQAGSDPSAPMTFEQLSAALGSDTKMGLDMDHPTDAPAGKGLAAEGYAAVGVAHTVAADNVKRSGELQVSGGITAAQVRSNVRDNAARLRVCYARGLQVDPRLSGRVMVSFSVDAQGAVYDVESQSDTLPGDVTSCVANIFSTITFAAPKAPPAKVTVPVDFNKDS